MKYIEYTPAYGKIDYPEGFAALLEGLTLEEQMRYFRVGNGLYLKEKFAERKMVSHNEATRLEECEDVMAVIVSDNKIAGIWVFDRIQWKERACMPERGYCCWHREEEDGSGYKEFTLYRYLICVPDTFE